MKIPLPLPFLLVALGFAINTVNYGLLTDKISPLFGFSGHENMAYFGLTVIVSGVGLFIYWLSKGK